jgi:hypothetical protein
MMSAPYRRTLIKLKMQFLKKIDPATRYTNLDNINEIFIELTNGSGSH